MLETINGRPEFVLVFERFMVDTIRIRGHGGKDKAQTAAERQQRRRGRVKELRELAQDINELMQRAFIGSSTVESTGDVDDLGRPTWRVETDWDAEVLLASCVLGPDQIRCRTCNEVKPKHDSFKGNCGRCKHAVAHRNRQVQAND